MKKNKSRVKVTAEIYNFIKGHLANEKSRVDIILEVKKEFKVKLGLSTLSLIARTENYLEYSTMPKYHKNQKDRTLRNTEKNDVEITPVEINQDGAALNGNESTALFFAVLAMLFIIGLFFGNLITKQIF